MIWRDHRQNKGARLKAPPVETDPDSMSTPAHVILVESLDGTAADLATQLRTFDVEAHRVPDLDSACETLLAREFPISVVMIPTDLPSEKLKKDIKSLRKVGPSTGLSLVSVGRSPLSSERKKLRAAGLTIAMWQPYDNGTLRFQLNRAISGDRNDHMRRSPRVPTYLLARICIGDRTKDAVVYSLSEGGAFLETPRASMEGADLEIELRLPSGAIHTRGDVLFSNVPGNLQQQNLPMGMGLRFTTLSAADQKSLTDFVVARYSELNV